MEKQFGKAPNSFDMIHMTFKMSMLLRPSTNWWNEDEVITSIIKCGMKITYTFPNFNSCTVEVLWMDKLFHLTLFWARNYPSMLGFKLNHVCKRGHWWQQVQIALTDHCGTLCEVQLKASSVMHHHQGRSILQLGIKCKSLVYHMAFHTYIVR